MIKTALATQAGKILRFLTVNLGKGSGEAAPGLLALKLDPDFILHRQENIPYRIIISGTNGKTTTTNILAQLIKGQRKSFITNPLGSNLSRGIASALLNNNQVDYALWEADEAALMDIALKTRPTHLVLLNLFRDQLDRYGEIDTTLQKWQKLLTNLSPLTLIINADDPSLNYLASQQKKHKVISFGFKSLPDKYKLSHPEICADAIFCPICHKPLHYKFVSFSHLGDYECSCGFKKINMDREIEIVKMNNNSTQVKIDNRNYQIKLGGLYSAYNLGAVVTVLKLLQMDNKISQNVIADFDPVYGRQEIITKKAKKIELLLIKNPTGANQIINTLNFDHQKRDLLIVINDNIADGTDVSWLWDVDFERLLPIANQIIVSGSRALDMGLRLKYAGFNMEMIKIEPNLDKAINTSLTSSQAKIYVLPTYTAMREIRNRIKNISDETN